MGKDQVVTFTFRNLERRRECIALVHDSYPNMRFHINHWVHSQITLHMFSEEGEVFKRIIGDKFQEGPDFTFQPSGPSWIAAFLAPPAP